MPLASKFRDLFTFSKQKSAPPADGKNGHKSLNKKAIRDSQNKRIIKDSHAPYYTPDGYGANFGGMHNLASGMGGPNDKSRQSFFVPTLIDNRAELETVKTESWAASRFIDFPIDQMFLKPRVFEDWNDAQIEKYKKYLAKFKLNQKLAAAMKAGRLYGSGFLVVISREAPLWEPLIVNEIREHDLLNLMVFDRFSTYVEQRSESILSLNYGQAEVYNISPAYGGTFRIHESRILRLDGQDPLTSDSWQVYNRDYGVSELIPVIQSIFQDTQSANGVSQLIEEASIGILKSEGYQEALGNAPDTNSAGEIACAINRLKSIYQMIIMDADSDFSRTAVDFTGLPQILDRFKSRLAAAAGIPETIFLSRSPAGMNATGEADLSINAANVLAKQELLLRAAYDFLDPIFTRSAGLPPVASYTFPSLVTLSETDKATVFLTKMQGVTLGVQNDVLTPDEGREIMSDDELVGQLEPREFNFSEQFKAATQNKLAAQNAKVESDKSDLNADITNSDADTANTGAESLNSAQQAL